MIEIDLLVTRSRSSFDGPVKLEIAADNRHDVLCEMMMRGKRSQGT